MRVVLIGPAAARARLRAQANGSLAIVDEAASVAAAREHAAAADAFLVAVDAGQGAQDACRAADAPRDAMCCNCSQTASPTRGSPHVLVSAIRL